MNRRDGAAPACVNEPDRSLRTDHSRPRLCAHSATLLSARRLRPVGERTSAEVRSPPSFVIFVPFVDPFPLKSAQSLRVVDRGSRITAAPWLCGPARLDLERQPAKLYRQYRSGRIAPTRARDNIAA